MNSADIRPPHLNSEIYRTEGKGTNTLSNFDYIKLHSDGSVLVGCSELTGRYWNGGANVRSSVEELQKELINGTKLGIQLSTSTADGCFIDDANKVLLCEDSGAIAIWNYVDNTWSQWEEVKLGEHDDVVMAVDSLCEGKSYITVGLDANVKVWDVEELLCVRDYRAAHSSGISSISVKPNSTKNFVTCSYDRLVCLWDYDKAIPVLDVAKSDSGLRCVQWLDENWLVFGDDSGILSAVDLRQPGNPVPLLTFPNSIHRVIIQNGSKRMAVCCDNKIVSVYEINEDHSSKCLYKDSEKHTNFVRGLVWDNIDKHTLHSVGWDGVLATHKFTCI